MRLATIARWYDRVLGFLVFVLMILATAVILDGVFFRYVLNDSLTWYDEVSEYLLVWLTYYGAAYAALKRRHIGFPTLVRMLPPRLRLPLLVVVELAVMVFFAVMAWISVVVMEALSYETLVSLPSINMVVPYSAMLISSLLFIVSQLLSFPQLLREGRGEEALLDGEREGP